MTNTIGSIRTASPQTLSPSPTAHLYLRRRRPARRYRPWHKVPSRIRPYVLLAQQRGELFLYSHAGEAR